MKSRGSGAARKIAWIAPVVVLLATVVTISLFVQNSGRPDKDVKVVLSALSDDVAYLRSDGWERNTRLVGNGSRGASEDFRQPSKNSYVWLEISREVNPVMAAWSRLRDSRKGELESDYPGLVREIPVSHLNADESQILCGNVQRSSTAELEKCGIWDFRARYGQYLLHVNVYVEEMSAPAFSALVRDVDTNMDGALASS